MMLYSVWNQGARQYDYYETPEVSHAANAEQPTHMRPGKLGVTLPSAAWPLPEDAHPVGSGDLPRGRIAAPHGGDTVGDVPAQSSLLWLAMGIGAAALLRRLV